MGLLRSVSRGIISYRLGYSPQRPYPWRWMTPIVLCAFISLAAFLAVMNVPLSAYEVSQEFTYRPNDTLPPLPLSNTMLGILPSPRTDFTPQILKVGDTFQLNNSVVNFTITAAFDAVNQTHPVPSFSYYNNPFSDGCDVTNITAILGAPAGSVAWELQFTVTVTCHIPTTFIMTSIQAWPILGMGPAGQNSNDLIQDFQAVFSRLIPPPPVSSVNERTPHLGLASFDVTVQPYCDCQFAGLDTPVDGTLPTRLIPVQRYIKFGTHPLATLLEEAKSTEIFPLGTQLFLDDPVPLAGLDTMFQNSFQSFYHLVRLDLGLILENQIYASREMYNRSISDVYVPDMPPSLYPAANNSRLSTSNATVMAEWKDSVRIFNNSDHVPVMLYLRPVPKLKPLGSAVISIFVSTFAMLSVVWTTFSVIAGVFAAKSHARMFYSTSPIYGAVRFRWMPDLKERKTAIDTDGWDSSETTLFTPEEQPKIARDMILERLSLTVENNNIRMSIAMAELQLSLARMRLLLRKHGISEDVDTNHIELDCDLTESRPLGVHWANMGSVLDSVG
ncbi:hypothetical protein DFH09DRAFT_1460676 [Mycena vulgaris]|nr:hypothetical protein DFH09DRAFT_1460676 [Mycena vulgaris]